MLTEAELSDIWADVSGAFPDTVRVERWQPNDYDEQNPTAPTGTWQVIAIVPGRIAGVGERGRDRDLAERFDIAAPKVSTVPAGTDVRPDDRITVGDASMVVRVVEPHSYQTAVRALGDSEAPGA